MLLSFLISGLGWLLALLSSEECETSIPAGMIIGFRHDEHLLFGLNAAQPTSLRSCESCPTDRRPTLPSAVHRVVTTGAPARNCESWRLVGRHKG
jgi:hypothetical protein